MTDGNTQTKQTSPTLADFQALLHAELTALLVNVVQKDELAEVLADLVTKTELERRMRDLASQQHNLDAKIASQQEAIAVVEALFRDIKTSIEGITGRLDNYGQVIDARSDEVEAVRNEQQQTGRDLRQVEQTLSDLRVAQRELRHDIFGTGDPNGPIAFAERVLEGIERLAGEVRVNYQALAARYEGLEARQTKTEQQVIEHGAFIKRRQAIEQGLLRWLRGVWSHTTVRRLVILLIGGGSGIALLEVLHNLLG